MKSGLRQMKVAEGKKTKKHVKASYKIMHDMEEISKFLDPTIDYNEENINEYVLPLYGRDLDPMEKFLVLGKIHSRKEDVVNNIEVKHGLQNNTE
jgi:hypothetical protein